MTTVFDKRFRGFRVINLIGWGLLATLVLGVYLAKTIAWRERNEIAAVQVQIRQEQLRIRLLEAEVAHLEQPRRLQALSSGSLGMAPILAKQEITAADLQRFARPKPEPVIIPAAPQPTAAAPVVAMAVVPSQGAQVQVTQQ